MSSRDDFSYNEGFADGYQLGLKLAGVTLFIMSVLVIIVYAILIN